MTHLWKLIALSFFLFLSSGAFPEEPLSKSYVEIGKSSASIISDNKIIQNELDMVGCQTGYQSLCEKLDANQEQNGYDSSVIHNPDIVHQESLEAMNSIDENATILNREALAVTFDMAKRDVKNKVKNIGKKFSDYMNERP